MDGMNIERASVNRILVTGRKVGAEAHYLCVFTKTDTGEVVKCISDNVGLLSGPLLIEVEETTGAIAVDGEVTLSAGDWNLAIYAQASAVNLDPAVDTRGIWTELTRID